MNQTFKQIQDKVLSITSTSEASNYVSQQMEDAITNKNTPVLLQILSIIQTPENREVSKLVNFYQVFSYLLLNVTIKQVSQIYQSFFKNNINACERSLVKIIESLQKEQNFSEIESLLEFVHDLPPDQFNLSDLFQPLIKNNNLELVRKYIINLPTDMYGYMDTWEKLIDNSIQKQIQINDLQKKLNEFAIKIQFQKPQVLLQVYNFMLTKLIAYQSESQIVKGIVLDMIRHKLEIRETNQNTFLNDLIAKFVDLKEVIKLIIQLKYCLKSSTFTNILRDLIRFDRKFELFCLIELILQEKGFSFKFDDLLLSQSELRYIIVQQSYFHNFLSRLDKKEEVSFDLVGLPDVKSNKKDYMWECISFASDLQSEDDI